MPVKAAIKAIVPRPLRTAGRNLQREIQIATLHGRGVRAAKALRDERELKLNFGCGSNKKQGWVNIDLLTGSDLQLDARRPIPLPDGCAAIVYSEHFFEHLEHPSETNLFLNECFRLLRSKGLFSVGVPDTEWVLDATADWIEAAKRHGWHPGCSTKMERLNDHFRQGGEHKYAWDFETLEKTLQNAGFGNIRRRDFDPELDAKWRECGTLYVDAVRPSRVPGIFEPAIPSVNLRDGVDREAPKKSPASCGQGFPQTG